MPAAPSSPIDPASGHLLAAVGSVDADRATVLSVLAAVADPRAPRDGAKLRQVLPTTISAVDFERLLAKGLADELSVKQAVVLLREATSVHQLPVRTRERLAEVQPHVVTLQLEQKLSAAR